MRALQTKASLQVHHQIPCCLLRLRDAADAHQEITPEALAAWMDFEAEALEHGVSPEIGRDELAALVESSTVEMDAGEHRNGHAEDFRRWGRRRGLRTLALYGAPWFSLLALKRHGKVGAEVLGEALEAMRGGRS